MNISFTSPIFFLQVPDQFDAFSNPKNASEKNAKISLRHLLLVNLKNVRALAPPMLLALNFGDNGDHLYSHRFTLPTEPCVL